MRALPAALAAICLVPTACESTVDLASDDDLDGGTADGSPYRTGDGGVILCNNRPCECNDGVDGDEDGLVDGFDPECTGPFDDDEASFGTGVADDNRDAVCQDCFFDDNSGSGNDGCRYPSSCLTTGMPTSGSSSCGSCAPSAECVASCRPLTPNGCDCYGCCEIHLPDGGTVDVLAGAGCSMDRISDASACPTCRPSSSCFNDCGPCEICPGRTLAELPPGCSEHTCDDGIPRCDVGVPCAEGFYCQLGCCVPTLF